MSGMGAGWPQEAQDTQKGFFGGGRGEIGVFESCFLYKEETEGRGWERGGYKRYRRYKKIRGGVDVVMNLFFFERVVRGVETRSSDERTRD